jgi:hypothetical protein
MSSKTTILAVSRVAKHLFTLSICLAALLLLGQLFAQKQVKESKEVMEYKALAEQGRVDIQFRLGELYDPDTPDYSHGHPRQMKGQPLALAVNKSFTEAARWYQMAANGGNVAAQARLADISREGKLSSVDLAKATNTVPTSATSDVSAQKRKPPVSTADLKLLKQKATDAKYFLSAATYAQEWVDALDADGTATEKALAHKWLEVHKGAIEYGNHCQSQEQVMEIVLSPTPKLVPAPGIGDWGKFGKCSSISELAGSDIYAQKSIFYENQGREFKAFAKKWDRMWSSKQEEETGEHIPTTAEVLAGSAADITGAVAQGRAQRAAINQQTAQVKEQQAEAQRRQQEQVAADAQRRSQEQVQQQQAANNQRLAEQQAASQQQQQQQNATPAAPVANYQPGCIRAEVSRERQCNNGNNVTLRVVSACSAPMNARFCVQRANGSWQCGEVDGVSTGVIANTNAVQYVCDGTGQTKVWMRTPLQGGWVPWPEP